MYFHCHVRHEGDWVVVAVVGELDLAAVPGVRSEVVAAVSRRTPARVALDLTGVELIDSVGLGLVVGALRRTRATGGELRVALGRGRVADAFALTGLDTLMPTAPTMDELLAEPAEAVSRG